MRVAAQRLGTSANSPEQPSVRGSDDATSDLGHLGHGDLGLADLNRSSTHLDVALSRVSLYAVRRVLRERAADDRSIVSDAVDDEATIRHGHGWDRRQDVIRDPALEVQRLVLDSTKQIPEVVFGQPLRNVVKSELGSHFQDSNNLKKGRCVGGTSSQSSAGRLPCQRTENDSRPWRVTRSRTTSGALFQSLGSAGRTTR